MRRLRVERPVLLARAACSAALFAAVATGISLGLLRFSWVEVLPGLAALAASLLVAVLAVLLALGAFVQVWRSGAPGAGRAFGAVVLGAALLAGPAYGLAAAALAPRLHDIATDPQDPPAFTLGLVSRPPGANPPAYDRGAVEAQRAAYPDIAPLLLDLPPDEVRPLVLALVKERRWRLVADVPPPQAETRRRVPMREQAGRIEAVARSLILGLPDDVALRLREQAGRTRVDMRSASRFGPADGGANAARIAAFLADLRERAQALPQPGA